jgi:sodium transport system permease protein
MNINFATVRTLARAELRMVLRDRRMLITSIVLPLLVTPLMFLGSTWTLKRRERTLEGMVIQYAVTGSEAAGIKSLLRATQERLRFSAGSTNKGLESATGSPERKGRGRARNRQAPLRFEEVACTNAPAALNQGEIQLILQGSTPEEARLENSARTKQPPVAGGTAGTNGNSRTELMEDEGEPSMPGVPVVRLVFRGDRDESSRAASRMEDALIQTRRLQRANLLSAQGFPVRPSEVAMITTRDVATKTQVAGLALGRPLTLLLLLFILTSGAVVATDSLAGEKERGTLETLLTSSATRLEILAAKQLVILAVALLITLIQSANLLVYIGFKLMPVPPNLSEAVSPAVAGLLFLLFLPVAGLAATVLLLISGYARSYKEAQMYFLPALLIGLLPALAPFLPGLSLRSIVVLVPVANIALAVKEVLVGVYDWPMILVSWGVTAGAAVWAMRFGVRFLSAEKLITAAETDVEEFTGGPALFERRVVRWFALLWAGLLLVSNYTERLDLRLQVTINLVGLFFCGSLLMIWRYRLEPRAALALRAPKPMVWLGVIIAVPGGLLTALALFQLSNLVLPVSSKLTESFNQTVISSKISTWQLFFFLTVMPGIFEEIAFRGLLLHGLRRRFHPAVLALVVGLAFGIFHVALFRFVPTAALGIFFAAVTMLSGSIFPAMLWHMLNNAAGILMYRLKLPENDLEPTVYLGGIGLLAAAFWIFWRNRTPYPGLRFRRRETLASPGAADLGSARSNT